MFLYPIQILSHVEFINYFEDISNRIILVPSCESSFFFSLHIKLSVSRLKVRTGRMGSNSSLSVGSRPDIQESWDLLKPASLFSSAGARLVCVH